VPNFETLKSVHTAYSTICMPIRKLLNWFRARDVNGRDRDETETLTIFLETRPRQDRDETLVRLETVSRSRRRDRDHNPACCIIV